MKEIRAMSPGKLGHGCDPNSVARGLERNPDFIAVDAGSTDIGAYYLGSRTPFFHPVSIKRDLALLVKAAIGRKIPLIVGNVLATGTNVQLQEGLEFLHEVARENSLQFRVAVVRAEIDSAYLKKKLREGPIPPLGAKSRLTSADVESAEAIVAQMGVEPLMRALESGAEVVLAGRACDDALFAAVPVLHGFDRGLALHMGKILECGSMACIPGDLHGSLIGCLREDHFVLEPPDPERICTVHSVASHTLYERTDPYRQAGPGGINDLSSSKIEQLDERRVKVSGSSWISDAVYNLKLEGARQIGFRTICMAGIRDPILISQLDEVLLAAERDTAERFDSAANQWRITFRQYGRNAVMGKLEPRADDLPHEVGLLIEVIAGTQSLADAVCMYVRGTLQHAYYPGILATAGNLAYPMSPFTVPCGPVYVFHIDHLLQVNDPCECFPCEVEHVGQHMTAVH
ncbi:MAG: acyclic terpene utilization AtuA family protein [Terriglobia bacterium]